MHIPVLQKEVVGFLAPKADENFVDCTFGEGGHAAAVLERNRPNGKILGIEADPELYQKVRSRMVKFSGRLILVNASYENLEEIAKREGFKNVSGILFDLGISSWHLEESGRGFSFLRDERLDMRFDGNSGVTAEKIVNEYPEGEIEKILRDYGEERFARQISRKIVKTRAIKPLKSTFQLAEVIKNSTPNWYRYRKIHFATRTFQALRIAVNGELKNLEKALPQALEILKPGGRLVVISFHSLEDRLVKNFLRNNGSELKTLTKKPVIPLADEIAANPRSRSAKLRAARKGR